MQLMVLWCVDVLILRLVLDQGQRPHDIGTRPWSIWAIFIKAAGERSKEPDLQPGHWIEIKEESV